MTLMTEKDNTRDFKGLLKNVILTMTAYKFVTTTTFDKEFKKLDKSVQKIIAKYIKNSQF